MALMRSSIVPVPRKIALSKSEPTRSNSVLFTGELCAAMMKLNGER
jgi:hypothetical protein